MKIINLFGSSGVGKSTTAAGLFYLMKQSLMNVELVTEYAKKVTWEGHYNILQDQLYLLAKQNRNLVRLKNHPIEYVVTDSPLLLGLVYCPKDYFSSFSNLVLDVFNSYHNLNVYLKRVKPYNPVGRNQTEEESNKIATKVKDMLKYHKIPHITIDGDKQAPQKIFDLLSEVKTTKGTKTLLEEIGNTYTA